MKENTGNVIGYLVNAGVKSADMKNLFDILDADHDQLVNEQEFTVSGTGFLHNDFCTNSLCSS